MTAAGITAFRSVFHREKYSTGEIAVLTSSLAVLNGFNYFKCDPTKFRIDFTLNFVTMKHRGFNNDSA